MRYLTTSIKNDLKTKMVFLGGPRQVGKTTLAIHMLQDGSIEHPAYFNWDFPEDRNAILSAAFPLDQPIIILDEIHKYRQWRNLVKGFYDKLRLRHEFLITGSAKLDYYRRGGDSLLGRYHSHRLHPLSIYEINPENPTTEDLQDLLKFGGFPEPFFSQNEVTWQRWRRERRQRIITEDLLSLERVREISQLDLLFSLLPQKVGGLLSVRSLQEDVQASHETLSKWLDISENLYYPFRIKPWTQRAFRGLKKEPKLFLWDWSECLDNGAKFENLVASNLLKFCHFKQDVLGEEWDLFFLRDKDKREVDFIVAHDRKPVFAVECKTGEKHVSPALNYFLERSIFPLAYQVHLGTRDFSSVDGAVRVMPFLKFVKEVLKV